MISKNNKSNLYRFMIGGLFIATLIFFMASCQPADPDAAKIKLTKEKIARGDSLTFDDLNNRVITNDKKMAKDPAFVDLLEAIKTDNYNLIMDHTIPKERLMDAHRVFKREMSDEQFAAEKIRFEQENPDYYYDYMAILAGQYEQLKITMEQYRLDPARIKIDSVTTQQAFDLGDTGEATVHMNFQQNNRKYRISAMKCVKFDGKWYFTNWLVLVKMGA
ncbi:MAG: hypothetical protein IPI59_06430 [Sphingobacteriales bacterium]|nr:hypothetical protein [Sphingobacteriales bacterium]MBP9142375.1 hypothetical protein [Chitinophagales bacterium]MDA0197761.1 hypothetical protein [Bacteroidota bacterium]MBK6890989.1 hypothetical protein [Sphingobacteriales bacterium]MBK7527180.1 hypothetical protein [Sphingobacteriales bacterium]